jgi:hypothetical protein
MAFVQFAYAEEEVAFDDAMDDTLDPLDDVDTLKKLKLLKLKKLLLKKKLLLG